MRDDNGYQLGLILTQLSRIADSLDKLVDIFTEKKVQGGFLICYPYTQGMSSGQYKRRLPKSRTVIKDGKIVRLRKDGRIQSVIDVWPPKKDKQMSFCEHVYKDVQAKICPTCNNPTHTTDWEEINVAHKKWVKENPDFKYSWWSI